MKSLIWRAPCARLTWCLLLPLQAQAAAPQVTDTMTPLTEQLQFTTWDGKVETATFSITDEGKGLRHYRLVSSAPQREDGPGAIGVAEHADWPRMRSSNPAFDALFALAVDEMQRNAVSEIRDEAYNNGRPLPCTCFETGAKWHYVWTRDLSYAADLGLALLDPVRTRNSLAFKLSAYREGVSKPARAAGSADGWQIVQDTGSGGSWPVSTDRSSWAFGAEAVLHSLAPEQRRPFAESALRALANSLDNDRLAAFDPRTGLYGGEQSFLDWREQSYASWIPSRLPTMATASALSTNAAFYRALRLAARLAQQLEQPARADAYRASAAALKKAINERLWREESGLYSSLTAGHFDGAPLEKFDWLGQSLAITTGIADPEQRRRILASYPHGPMGAPVIFPQQPGVPVYHNRAIWPFVTAYGLRAARMGNNVAVADSAMELLIRSAALNLSNMENLEWLSAQAMWQQVDDHSLSGPVINSRRQLWSVGAYLGLVVSQIFGIEATADGLQVSPYVSSRLRRHYLGRSQRLQLENLRLWGKRLRVTVDLPPVSDLNGVHGVARVLLDGKPQRGAMAPEVLGADSHIEVRLGPVQEADTAMTRVRAAPGAFDEAVFAPFEPELAVASREGRALVTISDTRNQGAVTYRLFRNGQQVAADLQVGEWLDPETPKGQACYAAVALFKSSGNHSHHSMPHCLTPGDYYAVDSESIGSNRPLSLPGPGAEAGAVPVLRDWGEPGDQFSLERIRIDSAGRYAFQFHYRNTQHAINTGITNGVKWLHLLDAQDNRAGGGVVQMPHSDPERPPLFSTPVVVRLQPGTYRLQLLDFYNMSYLAHNRSYTHAGGIGGPVNRIDLYGVRVLPLPE
jgi:hypothetical protein